MTSHGHLTVLKPKVPVSLGSVLNFIEPLIIKANLSVTFMFAVISTVSMQNSVVSVICIKDNISLYYIYTHISLYIYIY